MNKEPGKKKSLAKTIQGLIAEAEKMQNFSIFRGFPQASFKKNKINKSPTPVVWNAKLTVLLGDPSPPRLV